MANLDARAERSLQALMRAGLELLNQNKEASMSDIALRAKVGRATLYRHFETREQLIRAIARHCLDRIDKACQPIEAEAESAIDALRLLFRYIMPLTAELQFLMRLDAVAEQDPELLAMHSKQQQDLRNLVQLAKLEQTVDAQLPTEWIINLIEGVLYAAWLTMHEQSLAADEAAELAFRAMTRGIGCSN